MKISMANVRSALIFAACPDGSDPENAIINHLDTIRALEELDGKRASLVVLVAQGYSFRECSRKLGIPSSTVYRMALGIYEQITANGGTVIRTEAA